MTTTHGSSSRLTIRTAVVVRSRAVHVARALACLAIALLGAAAGQVSADTFGSGANEFDVEFVTIGDPGNPADTTGKPNPAGAVDYIYRIGKHEVSRDMIDKANSEGELSITLRDMSTAGGNGPNQPATGISWHEAAKFVNWLNESSGYPAAYNFTGNVDVADLWQPGDAGYDAANPFRNSEAHYFLPNADEWYKAAYYDPVAGVYYDYPGGSDTPPAGVAGGTLPDTAVYTSDFSNPLSGPAEITQAGGLSPYGTMAQGGNVEEWPETEWDLVDDDASAFRLVRGGYWFNSSGALASLVTSIADPITERMELGFRVASAVIDVPTELLGDYNSNGQVDAPDYTLWRDTFGEMGAALSADGNNNGAVDAPDYTIWRDNFGNTAGASVPEPSSIVFVTLALIWASLRRSSRAKA